MDYILLNDQLLSHTKELIIDEERMTTAYHITKCGATRKVTYTDHCSLMLTTECSKGDYRPKREIISVWNLTAEGYDKHRKALKGNIQLDSHLSPEEAYHQWQNTLTALLHNCFGKKTVRTGDVSAKPIGKTRKNVRKILREEAKKGTSQEHRSKKYIIFLHSVEEKRFEKNGQNS